MASFSSSDQSEGNETRKSNMDVEEVRRTLTSRAAGKGSAQDGDVDVAPPANDTPSSASATNRVTMPVASLALEAVSSGSQQRQRRGRIIARQLLAMMECPMCRKTLRDPVTLPCGHSSCLACIAAATRTPELKDLPLRPSSSYRPPRLPMASTTVPCGVADCPRSAIGRGLGVWAGHMATFGPPLPHHTDGGVSGSESGPGSAPFDGFVVGRPDDCKGLSVISPQKTDAGETYAVNAIREGPASTPISVAPSLRPDVTLSKVVGVLTRAATQPLDTDRVRSLLPTSSAVFLSDSDVLSSQRPAGRRSQAGLQSQRGRRRANTSNRFIISSRSPSPSSSRQTSQTRTSINPLYHAVMGISEAELESGAVSNLSVSWDTDDEEEENFRRRRGRFQTRPQAGDEARGWEEEEEEEEGDDDDIGGAFARQYTPAMEEDEEEEGRGNIGHQLGRRSVLPLAPLINSTADAKGDTISNDLTSAKGKNRTADELHSDLIDIFECQLCYLLLCEPMTTPCGHTFCRSCFARSLDHSDKCPLCRSLVPSFAFFQEHPSNRSLVQLLNVQMSETSSDGDEDVGGASNEGGSSWGFKTLYLDRTEAVEREKREALLSTPLFVCTLGFPSMPTILHIFEPRYRLMIRRCLESNNARFGMVMPSQSMAEPCPGMYQFGTMLDIKSVQMLPDGRSMIETVGSHRFRVLERGSLDGYTTGRIELIEDISEAEEDVLEQRLFVDRSSPASLPEPFKEIGTHFQSIIEQIPTTPRADDGPSDNLATEHCSTAQLIQICTVFIDTLRSGSAPWLLTRLNHTYGPMPQADDVVALGYWMALVMPIDEHEKAKLLPIRSAKVRLRIVVHWIEQLRQSWWFNNGCTVQ